MSAALCAILPSIRDGEIGSHDNATFTHLERIILWRRAYVEQVERTPKARRARDNRVFETQFYTFLLLEKPLR